MTVKILRDPETYISNRFCLLYKYLCVPLSYTYIHCKLGKHMKKDKDIFDYRKHKRIRIKTVNNI